MDRLKSTLERFGKPRRGPSARWWTGPTPEARKAQLPYVIAAQLGYETPEVSTRSQDELQKPRGALKRIDRPTAALTLAFAAGNSIAGGGGRTPPRPGLAKLADEALRDLAADAEFYSNGRWPDYWTSPSFSFSGISQSTFDAGVVGFDRINAFIFWIEEED